MMLLSMEMMAVDGDGENDDERGERCEQYKFEISFFNSLFSEEGVEQ